MKIVDMHWTPGTPIYSIVCDCGADFSCAADLKGRVKCHQCRREAYLHTLLREWEATLAKPPRLKEIAKEVRELYERWLALTEPERGTGEGERLASRIEELYDEAMRIIRKTSAREQP